MDTDEQISSENLDLNQPINWDKIDEEYSGNVFGLNYVYVFEENDDEAHNERANGDAVGHEQNNGGGGLAGRSVAEEVTAGAVAGARDLDSQKNEVERFVERI